MYTSCNSEYHEDTEEWNVQNFVGMIGQKGDGSHVIWVFADQLYNKETKNYIRLVNLKLRSKLGIVHPWVGGSSKGMHQCWKAKEMYIHTPRMKLVVIIPIGRSVVQLQVHAS